MSRAAPYNNDCVVSLFCYACMIYSNDGSDAVSSIVMMHMVFPKLLGRSSNNIIMYDVSEQTDVCEGQ